MGGKVGRQGKGEKGKGGGHRHKASVRNKEKRYASVLFYYHLFRGEKK